MIKNIHQLCTNYKMMHDKAAEVLTNYLIQNPNIKSLVIGISGGIDSAVCAAIARKAIYDVPGVKLIGRSIPGIHNTIYENKRASSIGHGLCDDFRVMPLFQTIVDNVTLSMEIFYK